MTHGSWVLLFISTHISSYAGRNRKKEESRCQEAERNVDGNIIGTKSAALPGKSRSLQLQPAS